MSGPVGSGIFCNDWLWLLVFYEQSWVLLVVTGC